GDRAREGDMRGLLGGREELACPVSPFEGGEEFFPLILVRVRHGGGDRLGGGDGLRAFSGPCPSVLSEIGFEGAGRSRLRKRFPVEGHGVLPLLLGPSASCHGCAYSFTNHTNDTKYTILGSIPARHRDGSAPRPTASRCRSSPGGYRTCLRRQPGSPARQRQRWRP